MGSRLGNKSVFVGSVWVQPEVMGSSSRKDLCLCVVALVGYLAIGRIYLLDLGTLVCVPHGYTTSVLRERGGLKDGW